MTAVDQLKGFTQGVAIKPACRVATTGAITLSGHQTIDGQVTVDEDRVLVKDQADAVDNGIYIADSSTWVRPTDFDGSKDVVRGTLVYVTQGTLSADLLYTVNPDSTATRIVVDTDELTISALSFNSSAGLTSSQEGNIDRMSHYVRPEDYSGSETVQFQTALATGKHVLIGAGPYSISGTFEIASGTTIEFQDSVININVDGDDGRGFWFKDGVTDARIIGTATINATCDTASTLDGSRNGVFSFGSQFYVTSTPSPTLRCVIDGSFDVNSVGSANCKIVQMYGYVEDCLVRGVRGTGMTNFCFVAHWIGNGTSTTVATSTWHPNRIEFRDCVAVDDGSGVNLRAFTFSGAGKAICRNCHVQDVATLGYNMFVGDYGGQFAQNIDENECMNYALIDCTFEGPTTAISGDAISANLLGSAQWSGWEHNARLYVQNFKANIDSGTAALPISVGGYHTVTMVGLDLEEEGSDNTKNAMQMTGVKYVYIQGHIKAQKTCLMRDIENCEWHANVERVTYDWTTAGNSLSTTQSGEDVTTDGAVSEGDTSIIFDSVTGSFGPGSYGRYTSGGEVYEFDLESNTDPGSTTQTISTRPIPIDIPDGATIHLVSCVKNFYVGPVTMGGGNIGFRVTGSSINKCRGVMLDGTKFTRVGDVDVSINDCENFTAIGTKHSHSGQSTDLTNSGIFLASYVEGFNIHAAHFDNQCRGLRYGIRLGTAGVENGIINGTVMLSVSSTATNPGAVFVADSTGQNVYITNTITSSGITLLP